MKIDVHCPKHEKVVLREEFDGPRNCWTLFCSVCLKHYDKCKAHQYMWGCPLLENHEGPHVDPNGSLFLTEKSGDRAREIR